MAGRSKDIKEHIRKKKKDIMYYEGKRLELDRKVNKLNQEVAELEKEYIQATGLNP